MKRTKGIKLEKVTILNSDKVVLTMSNGKKIEVTIEDYDLLNSTGAINNISCGNGYWSVRYKGKGYSLQRFLKLRAGLYNGEDKVAMHVKGVNYNGSKSDVKMVTKREYVIEKLLKGIDRNKERRNKTKIDYTYFNETEQLWQVRIRRYNGKMKTKRTANENEIYNIIREIQLANIQEALEAGDMAYVANRMKKWNLK